MDWQTRVSIKIEKTSFTQDISSKTSDYNTTVFQSFISKKGNSGS